MKIQYLSYSGEKKCNDGDFTNNKISEPKSLDEFDINIIDLDDADFWRYNSIYSDGIDSEQDLEYLGDMIDNKRKTRILMLLPQNIAYSYSPVKSNNSIMKTFSKKINLKNMLDLVQKILNLVYGYAFFNLKYEQTTTKVGEVSYEASFYFSNFQKAITRSNLSEKETTVSLGDDVFTTLKIESEKDLINLINFIFSKNGKEIPEWVKEFDVFDDSIQKYQLSKSKKEIEELEYKILSIEKKLEKNNYYKSILFSTGEELVYVVTEVLENLLNYDLKEFVDEKKADLIVKLEKVALIIEIKGVNDNVKKKHVSQVRQHVYTYEDEAQHDESSIKGILVINHQKEKKISERIGIHEDVSDLAKKDESLIIETLTLLKMFDDFLNGKIKSEEVVELLIMSTGILEYEIKN